MLRYEINTILNATKPQYILELQSHLSIINYFGTFLYLCTILQHLNNRSDMKWVWSTLCDKSVDAARQGLVSSKV